MNTSDYLKPDICHQKLFQSIKPTLAYDGSCDLETYKKQLRTKFLELLGDMPEQVPANVVQEWEEERDSYIEKRFIFDTETNAKVPCHLWIPKDGQKKHGVVICLQGHSTGMHISMGRVLYEGDERYLVDGDRDFACQIIEEGYAALMIEQRALGERKTDKIKKSVTCPYPAMTALLLGRTLLGERVWDVSRAIDALEAFDEIDTSKVAVMGNSGGGTTAYYAACYDERIRLVMPSCAVCSYADSIGASNHCVCNYLPGAAKYFDMGELAALIAPRPLIVVCGREDPMFPLHAVEKVYETVRKIYRQAGAAENCRLVVGDGGHRFYADPSWDVLRSFDVV